MRSAIHEVFGDPAAVLRLAEMPLPQPVDGQVRVRTILSPIHNHDLWTVRGAYGYKPVLPAIGGSEAVGIVDAVGPGCDRQLIGKRVVAAGVHGTWAEHFIAPVASLVPVPDVISDEAAAQLIAMPFSAIALLEFLDVEKGDWIIQNAANGAVGKTLAMLAHSRGVHCVSLVRRDAGVEEMAAFGVENVISTAGPDWKSKVRALVGNAPIRAAVDSVGGVASNDLADLLGENGLLITFGTAAGRPMQIASGAVIFKQLTIKGFWGSKISAAMPAEERLRLIAELIHRVAVGEVKLPVEASYDMTEIAEAVKSSMAPGKAGKVLLKP